MTTQYPIPVTSVQTIGSTPSPPSRVFYQNNAGAILKVDSHILPQFIETAISSGEKDVYRRALENFDRLIISQAMRQSNGNQSQSAEIFGLSRVTLRAKLLGIGLSNQKASDS